MKNCASNRKQSQELAKQLENFVSPLLVRLDKRLDKRLLRTFLQSLLAILSFRHSSYGLLLSELGAYILSPDKAPAGPKRLSNLLRSTRWGHWMLAQFLWKRADAFVQEQAQAEKVSLVIWDESVIEKSESIALEGLCAVRSRSQTH